MHITTDELLQIIGTKEAELFALRKQLQQAQAETSASANGTLTTTLNVPDQLVKEVLDGTQ